MLVLKKINKKRLAAYFLIITIMVGGSIFLVYKNYEMTRTASSPIMNFINLEDLAKINASAGSNGEKKQAVPNSRDSNVKENMVKIFNDPKFKALEDNSVPGAAGAAEIGKKDPFEPKK